MLEIEAKVQVEDHEPVRARLRDCGARHVGDTFEVNTFFDAPDRSLLSRDMGLRLRRTSDAVSGRQTLVVTSKGPAAPGALNQRDEIEFTVSDADAASRLFERLGFRSGISFEKRRESWELDGCQVELDELPHLGTFVEIEGASEQMILRVSERLALQSRPVVKKSYVAMFADLIERAKVPGPRITFDLVKRASSPRSRPGGSVD